MKKINLGIAALALCSGMWLFSSCGSKNSTDSSDSGEMEVAETEVMTETENLNPSDNTDYVAIFSDPAKKSDVASDSTYAVTASGLKYLVLREGEGVSPKATDEVEVHYRGQLTNGEVFDSSYMHGERATFPLNRVIPGWTEGLQLMKTGGKTVFYIPSNLAYGEQGAPGAVPPNSDLIFTVELFNVNAK